MSREEIIALYFEEGLTASDMAFILEQRHDITLSIRHIKRILQRLGLSKRNYNRPTEIVGFIESQLLQSGQQCGYRMMYQKCMLAGLRVRMEDVRTILQIMDPNGVEIRQARRLQRRSYFAKGPNFVWHIDGYDKLKPYGLCIHGCICGYSRKIIWLNVHTTNNNPRIVGGYFIEAIQKCRGVPLRVRGDFGTENVLIRDIQEFFRRAAPPDQQANHYLAGTSVTNQRIESWWGFLRRACVQFWMNIFKDLLENGEFDGDFLDKNLVQFCFISVVQDDIDTTANMWNSHTIRPSRNSRVPSGRPSHMYSFPSLWGVEDQLCPVSQDDIDACSPGCEFRSPIPCDADVYELCIQIMNENNINPPQNADESKHLYRLLRNELNNLLQ